MLLTIKDTFVHSLHGTVQNVRCCILFHVDEVFWTKSFTHTSHYVFSDRRTFSVVWSSTSSFTPLCWPISSSRADAGDLWEATGKHPGIRRFTSQLDAEALTDCAAAVTTHSAAHSEFYTLPWARCRCHLSHCEAETGQWEKFGPNFQARI